MSSSPIINFMRTALTKSSRFLYRDFFELEMQQSSKRPMDNFVEQAYKRVEENLRSELSRYQNVAVITDNPASHAYNDVSKLNFSILPISSTRNMLHALPFFATVICAYYFSKEGQIIPSSTIIDFPALGETFTAEKGGGAWMERHFISGNNKAARLRTSKRSDDLLEVRDTSEHANHRYFGDEAYAICLLAAGKIDSVHFMQPHPTISLAAELIVREAGGKVASTKPLELHNGSNDGV